MARGVRGETPLPGATERLLQATTPKGPPPRPRMVTYAAVSVSVLSDDSWAVRALRLDVGSGRIVPEWLDGGSSWGDVSMSPNEMVRHWAHELVHRP